MLLAQIVYLVIDVGKSIIGESRISVDMIEKYIKSFFLKKKKKSEVTVSVKS